MKACLKKSSRFGIALLLAFVFVAGTYFTCNGALRPDIASYSMAIAHFDGQHVKGIKYQGPEHEFMKEALRQAKLSAPELHHLKEDRGFVGIWDEKYDPLSVLVIERRPKTYANQLPKETVDRIANSIAGGCRRAMRTAEVESRNGAVRHRILKKWFYDESCKSRDKTCNNQNVAKWLCLLGLRWVVMTNEYSYSEHGRRSMDDAKLFLVFDKPCDVEYLITKITKDSLYGEVFLGKRPTAARSHHMNFGTPMTITQNKKSPSFKDPVFFKFSIGWGDCPSGCMAKHLWTVKANPLGKNKEGKWEFTAEVISEEGDKLPEEVRRFAIEGKWGSIY